MGTRARPLPNLQNLHTISPCANKFTKGVLTYSVIPKKRLGQVQLQGENVVCASSVTKNGFLEERPGPPFVLQVMNAGIPSRRVKIDDVLLVERGKRVRRNVVSGFVGRESGVVISPRQPWRVFWRNQRLYITPIVA
jgi:hypothetical protein